MGEPERGVAGAGGLRGRVVYLFAYDLAYEIRVVGLEKVLGAEVGRFAMEPGHRGPRQFFSYRPAMVRLPGVDLAGPRGVVRAACGVKLLPVGATSIAFEVPFDGETCRGLVDYHDLGAVVEEAGRLAEQLRLELGPWLDRPVGRLADVEAYTVFCIEADSPDLAAAEGGAAGWFGRSRRDVAAILVQEPEPGRLSAEEAEESTARHLRYYADDLAVVDWDAALLVDRGGDFDSAIYLMELANVQLAELEAYDRIVDHALERSYRELARRGGRGRAAVEADLRELQIDMARFSDELGNTTKFFGDWHLARLYEMVAGRFHLADWHRSLERKLRTLDSLYQIVKHDQTNRWMLVLEATIVLLFVLDLVLLFWRAG